MSNSSNTNLILILIKQNRVYKHFCKHIYNISIISQVHLLKYMKTSNKWISNSGNAPEIKLPKQQNCLHLTQNKRISSLLLPWTLVIVTFSHEIKVTYWQIRVDLVSIWLNRSTLFSPVVWTKPRKQNSWMFHVAR